MAHAECVHRPMQVSCMQIWRQRRRCHTHKLKENSARAQRGPLQCCRRLHGPCTVHALAHAEVMHALSDSNAAGVTLRSCSKIALGLSAGFVLTWQHSARWLHHCPPCACTTVFSCR